MKQHTGIKILTTISIGFITASLAQANLLVNGSFETATTGTVIGTGFNDQDSSLPGWRLFATPERRADDSVAVEIIEDAATASDGDHYLKIVSSFSGSGDFGLDTTYTGLGAVELEVGTEYTWSFDYQYVAGPANSLNYSVIGRATTSSSENVSYGSEFITMTGDGNWHTISGTFTPTAQDSANQNLLFYIGFRPKVGGELREQTLLLDNVSLIPEPSAAASVFGLMSLAFVLKRRR